MCNSSMHQKAELLKKLKNGLKDEKMEEKIRKKSENKEKLE